MSQEEERPMCEYCGSTDMELVGTMMGPPAFVCRNEDCDKGHVYQHAETTMRVSSE